MIDPVKIAQDVKQFRERMQSPAVLELFSIMAQEKYAKYTSYVRAGFDPRQALELVIRGGAEVSTLRQCECGTSLEPHIVCYGEGKHYAFCSECGVQTEDYNTDAKAEKAWNDWLVE